MLVETLIFLLVLILVLYIAQLIIGAMGLPPQVSRVVWLIIAIVALLALLQRLGLVGAVP